MTPVDTAIAWPPKYDVFGVQLSAVTREQALDSIMRAAHQHESAVVSAFSAHALVEASNSREAKDRANRFAIITPDGQPVRWALNWLYGVGLARNVRGSDLMWDLCKRAATEGVSIYLYGSTPQTLDALQTNLLEAFPNLIIAGVESPPFRPLSPAEDEALVHPRRR